MLDLSGISLRINESQDEPSGATLTDADAVLPGSYTRFALRSRNGVAYLICRQFSAAKKREQLAMLKSLKRDLPERSIDLVAEEMVACLKAFAGGLTDIDVTSVACGHSRRPDCLSFRLATGVANRCGARRVHTFRNRFLSGSSHPKEFKRLPQLQFDQAPTRGTLVVDDVATSGFHITEALEAIRATGMPALGLVWISGS